MNYLLFLFLIVYSTCLSGTIYESRQFSDLLDHLDEETWVVLDIDNTLIEPVQTLGSDQWFRYRIHWYKEQGEKENCLAKALDEWQAVQFITKVKIVEEGTSSLIRSLQESGFYVMGLTSRGLALATRTVEQLESVGINLSLTSFFDRDLLFFNPRAILYRKGVLFCSGTHKGEAFRKMLEMNKMKPKSIVFIDDQIKDLLSVEEVCTQEGIRFVGLRYGFTDEKVKNFNHQIANVQFYQMSHILSDQAAERILNPK